MAFRAPLLAKTIETMFCQQSMHKDQLVIGIIVMAGCATGFFRADWILAETKYGQLLRWCFGAQRAPLALRMLLFLGAAFGLLLAINVIRPLRW